MREHFLVTKMAEVENTSSDSALLCVGGGTEMRASLRTLSLLGNASVHSNRVTSFALQLHFIGTLTPKTFDLPTIDSQKMEFLSS